MIMENNGNNGKQVKMSEEDVDADLRDHVLLTAFLP